MRPSRAGPALVPATHYGVVIEAILLVLLLLTYRPKKLEWPGCGP